MHLIAFLTAFFLLLAVPSTSQTTQIRSALEQRNFREAETLLTQLLEQEPGNGEAMYLYGVFLSELGRSSDAELYFRQAVASDSGLIPAWLSLSEVLSLQGKGEEAVKVLQGALARHPGDVLLTYHLGVQLARDQQFSQALEYLESIPAERQPHGYWETIGRTYLSAGDLDRAEKAYTRVLRENPKSVKTLQVLSAIALKQDEVEKAWQHVAEARRNAPNSSEVVYAFAVVSLQNNLVAEAIAALRLLMLREPRNPDYLLMLGNTVLESPTEYSKAADYFAQYVEEKPDDVLGQMMLGYAHYVNHRYDLAQPQLKKVLSIDPDFSEARYYLAMIAFNQNLVDEAVQLLEDVIEKVPKHGKAQQTLGKIYLRQGKFQEAVQLLEEALSILGGNSDIHFNLSRIYAQMGDREKAQEQIELYREHKAQETERETESRHRRYWEMLREQRTP